MVDTIKVVAATGGSDPAVATDDIGGIHYQKVKIGWGADNTWTETTDTDAIRLPVGGAQLGTLTETAPASDTASSGLNGRLQRIAQRLTSLIGLLPTALGAGGGLKVDGSGTALPVSGTVAVSGTVPTSSTQTPASLGQKAMAASFAVVVASDQSAVPVTANAGTNLNTSALVTETNDAARQGGVAETAPASDTASSGLNGRLQRIAQRITSLIALLPTALTTQGSALKVGASESIVTCSVASGQTVSAAVDLAGSRNLGLLVPSTFDGTTITFQVCDSLAGSYGPLYDITNTQVAMTIAASRAYDLPGELMVWRFLKIVCGTAQATTATDFLLAVKT